MILRELSCESDELIYVRLSSVRGAVALTPSVPRAYFMVGREREAQRGGRSPHSVPAAPFALAIPSRRLCHLLDCQAGASASDSGLGQRKRNFQPSWQLQSLPPKGRFLEALNFQGRNDNVSS